MRQRAEFVEFATANWTRFARAAYSLGCDRGQAEDLTQQTLMRAWERWDRVSEAANPSAYVYKIMINQLKRDRRRRWTAEVPSQAVPDLPDALDGAIERQVDVRRAIMGLSLDHRAVIVLRYLEDLSEAESAEVLDVPIGTVKSRTSRALAQLKSALDQLDEIAP